MTEAAFAHRKSRRRQGLLIAAGLLRAAISAAVMVAAYYLVPLRAGRRAADRRGRQT